MTVEAPIRSVPDAGELRSAARALVPLLRANAAHIERERNLPPEVVSALRDAGMFRLALPAEFGGYALGFRATAEIVLELGRGCASTAWTVANDATCTAGLQLFSPEVVKEIFADAPDTVTFGSQASADSTARQVEGGYLINGKGPWASTCQLAGWGVFLVVPIRDGEDPPTQAVTVAVSAADIEIADTWHVAGLGGTGTQTVVLKDVFVPSDRVLVHDYVPNGRFDQNFTEQVTEHYRPSASVGSAGVGLASFVGAARGALDLTREALAKGRPMSNTTYLDKVDSPTVRLLFAEASHLIDSAELHLLHAVGAVDADQGDVALDWTQRARIRMHLASAVENSQRAMAKLLDISGASAFALANPLQRYWRDVEVGIRHAQLCPPMIIEDYSRALLGIAPSITILG